MAVAASNVARSFEDRPALRGPTPLLFGLIGPSGSGKTYSALRLATGMQRVIGGDIFLIDTESNRALHYADKFRFRHVPFPPPFSPLDYLAAIEHCQKKGAKIVIIDSMSHEHEGPGGVLEWHEQEVERLMKAWRTDNAEKVNIPAWGRPKAARRRLINSILQMDINFVFCFRAKDKIKIGSGKGRSEVVQLGFMPIAGEEFVYELTAKALLLPGANGVPTLRSDQVGEQMMIKIPEQFRGIFTGAAGKPLDEEVGEQMAQWAAGGQKHELAAAYEACNDAEAFEALEKKRADAWKSLSADQKREVKAASDAAAERLKQADTAPTESAEAESVDEETGEVLTLDGNPPEHATQAIAQLEEAFSDGMAALRKTWGRVTGEYAERDEEIPLDVEAKYTELREALEEQEGEL